LAQYAPRGYGIGYELPNILAALVASVQPPSFAVSRMGWGWYNGLDDCTNKREKSTLEPG